MYLLKKAQIAYLKADEDLTKVPSKYIDFVDIFLLKLAVELFEYTKINNHVIKFVNDKQPCYSSIYTLGLIKLEILKIYIENNLANGFIRSSISITEAFIFFNKKLDRSLQLCVDYLGLNNPIIKNCYFLPLVRELLDWLSRVWYFI